ncbi:MAG: pantetheine-phosphate adenylyltransferase [Dehalococcoidia bacterium]|nr:pantetheine-phosphate adenylyltransferase [Dehalococcoidia bacterium]
MSGHPRVALYPATFDPPTNGHLDIARRAAQLFDRVVAAVYAEPSKTVWFGLDERVELLREALVQEGLTNVEARPYEGLTVTLAREVGANAIVRGLRAVSDFEGEFQLASMNEQMAPDIETVLLMAGTSHFYLSSTIVKEIVWAGGEVSAWVPAPVAEALTVRSAALRARAAGDA